MHPSLTLARILFLTLCTLLSTLITSAEKTFQITPLPLLFGALTGLIFGGLVIGLGTVFKRFDLRSFNTATIGLFFGYLLGEALISIFQAAISDNTQLASPSVLLIIRSAILLSSCYLGMFMTLNASNELYLSIPFIKFKSVPPQKKKDLLIDLSALSDPRLIDLATTGLVDQRLVIPNFMIKELYDQLESSDEMIRSKARRSLDTVKKLEGIPELELNLAATNNPDTKDPNSKISRVARQLEANVLTADPSRNLPPNLDGVRYINLNGLSSALKPLSQTGEILNIKIQRYGKEPRQGVGYLDDGTMVVVNGAAEFIGATIRVQVLSVKHTTSGRMIFCNTLENESDMDPSLATSASSASNYFAV